MSLACTRSLFFTVFIAGSLALGASYYLEYAVGLSPCGLCLVQRLFLAMLTGISLLASIHGPGRFGSFVYWSLGLLTSLAGTATAWRQVVLQSAPVHSLRPCSADLLNQFADESWLSVVRKMYQGTADCSRISWTLFDLSIAEWSLLFFLGLTLLSGYRLLRQLWTAARRPLGGESSQPILAGD